MFEEDQDVGSLLERSIVVNSLSLDVLLNVERDLPASSQFSNPTFGSWYVWAYIAVTASSARLPAITFFVIINKY